MTFPAKSVMVKIKSSKPTGRKSISMLTYLSNPPLETETVSEEELGREKEKARRLKRTHWWDKKIQRGICHYCHCNVGREQLTMDHVVPLSRGGKSNKGNIVPACKECNNKKKYLVPIEWEEYLKSLAQGTLDS